MTALTILLLWSVRRQSPGKVIVWVTLLSFIYNLVFIRINETHTFYMPMSRFWELGLGGLLGLRQAQVLEALQRVHLSPSVQVLYPHDYLCDEVACAVENGALALYTDDDHLSIEGTRPIVENLLLSLQVLQ